MSYASQKSGRQWEAVIEKSLKGYYAAGVAAMALMTPPVVPAGRRGPHGEILWRMKGQAPFDIYGYTMTGCSMGGGPSVAAGVFIGCELKFNDKPLGRLKIVGADTDGSGLEYHQLAALAHVARQGGLAYVVWDNGGEVLVLNGGGLSNAFYGYEAAVEMERRGNKPPIGAKSIKPERFKIVQPALIGGVPCLHWLGLG